MADISVVFTFNAISHFLKEMSDFDTGVNIWSKGIINV